MAEEPDNLVLTILREMRAGMKAGFTNVGSELSRIDATLTDVRRHVASLDVRMETLDEKLRDDTCRSATPDPGFDAAHRKAGVGKIRGGSRALLSTLTILALTASTGLAPAHGVSEAGEPALASAAARTVAIDIVDAGGDMAFRPGKLEIAEGTAVRFVVHNRGALAHEFVIGDAKENAAHKAMMAQMPDMKHNDANAKTLAPGATATLVWRFTHAGRFEFACLLPGHYEAGMHGEVIVK